jgi:CheY-like chemotaxis protein
MNEVAAANFACMKAALLIHASPTFAASVRAQLVSFGAELELHVATSARVAQTLWKDHDFALVVCPLRLPVVGTTRMSALEGLQFLRLLHRRKTDLRSLVLHGVGEEVYASACLDAGVSLVLPDPSAGEPQWLAQQAMLLLGQTPRKVSGGVDLGALASRRTEWVQGTTEGELGAHDGSLRPELRLDLMDFLAHKARLLGGFVSCGEYLGSTLIGKGFEAAIVPERRLFVARQNGRPEISTSEPC